MPLLQTQHVEKRFEGVHAIDGVSLGIEKGTITSIIGPNGSGKTTLMNVISGVYPIDEGAIVLDGEKLTHIAPYEIATFGITRTFQNVRVFEQMTVLDNILVVLTKRTVLGSFFEKHTKQHLHQAQEVLERVGLWKKRNDLARNLSYGQRKLLEIARTLATDAKLYLLDEPFAGLFPEMVKLVVSIMEELRSQGRTILLIEHNMELIRRLSDYVFVMDSGRLLAQGKPNEVLERKDVIEAYLGA